MLRVSAVVFIASGAEAQQGVCMRCPRWSMTCLASGLHGAHRNRKRKYKGQFQGFVFFLVLCGIFCYYHTMLSICDWVIAMINQFVSQLVGQLVVSWLINWLVRWS